MHYIIIMIIIIITSDTSKSIIIILHFIKLPVYKPWNNLIKRVSFLFFLGAAYLCDEVTAQGCPL